MLPVQRMRISMRRVYVPLSRPWQLLASADMTPGRRRAILAAARDAYRGVLPERYHGYPASFRAAFENAVERELAGSQAILDVGGGRSPTIPPGDRPRGCRYVGLDISKDELERAPTGSYDAIVPGNIAVADPSLNERFDLVVSFQALEHVRGLARAFENMRMYLRPGGRLVTQLSGRFAIYALIGRITPDPITHRVQRRLFGRAPDTVFRGYYDQCYFRALERITASWSDREIVPLWIAEPYFHFSPLLRAGYLAYEEWAREDDRKNLAPYYRVIARR